MPSMQDFVIASDFDGTLKEKGEPVSQDVLNELINLRSAGVGLILVTGRCLKELSALIDIELFHAVVLENGALVLMDGKLESLAPPGWEEIRKALASKYGEGCEKVIISLPRDTVVDLKGLPEDRIRLEYNKDRLMILPSEVSKAKGLSYALKTLAWMNRKLVCIGDGENDESMLLLGNYRIALKNSVDKLKKVADVVVNEDDGKGFLIAIRELFGNHMNK
ncbi:MAG: HAD family hydrolase [Conexivisphaerales archaeon]